MVEQIHGPVPVSLSGAQDPPNHVKGGSPIIDFAIGSSCVGATILS